MDRRTIEQRLRLVLDWYRGMVSEDTGRLLYLYDPETDEAIADGSAIRDIASIWDMELLGRFLGRDDLRPLVEWSLRHFAASLVERDGALVPDPARLGEPTGIAHAAFLLLALLDAEAPPDERLARGLVEALLRQQRQDGSYRIYFGGEPDDGLELYPGEAMLALVRAQGALRDPRCLESVERAFVHYAARLPAVAVERDLLVFHANWQSQYAVHLHASTRSDAIRSAVRDHVFALHDRVRDEGFYEDVERRPARQATVEVACGLEGLADAWAIASRERDEARLAAYACEVERAVAWLLRAQRLSGTARERGGFGHSLGDRTQRIDVTGHVLAGLVKTVEHGLAA